MSVRFDIEKAWDEKWIEDDIEQARNEELKGIYSIVRKGHNKIGIVQWRLLNWLILYVGFLGFHQVCANSSKIPHDTHLCYSSMTYNL